MAGFWGRWASRGGRLAALDSSPTAVTAQLKQQEQRTRTLLESLPALVWTARPDGYCDYFSPQWEAFTGTAASALLGQGWMTVVHPDDLPPTLAIWERLLRDGTPGEADYRIRSRDGAFRWFKVRATPLADERGRVTQWFGTATDIDASRRLSDNQGRLLAFIDSSPDAIGTVDLAGRVTSWNPAAEQLFGYSKEELLGKPVLPIVPEDRVAEERAMHERAAAGETTHLPRTERRNKQGRRIPVSITCSPIRDGHGKVAGASVIARDITEQLLVEGELLRSQEVLEQRVRERTAELERSTKEARTLARDLAEAQEIARIGSWSLDVSTGRVDWSAAFFRLFGQSPHSDGAQYDDHRELFPEESWLRIENAVQEAIATGEGYEILVEFVRSDGAHRWATARGIAVRDEHGVICALRGTFQDVTELELARQQESAANERFRLAALAANIAVWDGNLVTGRTTWDAAMHRLYGSKHVPTFEEWLAQVLPEDRDRVVATYRYSLEGQSGRDETFRIRRPDGSVRWIHSVSHVQRGPDGKPRRIVGVDRDVTEPVEAELGLRERTAELEKANRLIRTTAADLAEAQRIAALGSWRIEAETRLMTASAELHRIYGYTDDLGPIDYRHMADRHPPESWKRMAELIELRLRVAGNCEAEFEISRQDGTRRIGLVRAVSVVDSHGTITAVRGTFQDITERRLAEYEAASSRERLRLATEAAGIGVWDVEFPAGTVHWDETVQRLYGHTARPTQETWFASIVPEDRERVRRIHDRSLATREGADFTFRIRRPDGAVRWLQSVSSLECDAEGNPVRAIGINRDVTEERVAELRLRASEQQLQEFVRDAPVALALFDRSMRYLQVSSRWVSEYGLENTPLLGRSHYEVFPALPQHWKAVHERVLAGASERSAEDSFQRDDGSLQWVQWEARPWRRADGEIGGLILTTQDVTARKETELALERREADLRRSNQELERFAYVASHDLQEPLRAVSGCVQLLQRRYATQLDTGADELIRHAIEGTSRMQGLILDLLAYSRVTSGGRKPQPLDLEEVLQAALANLDASIQQAQAEITVQPGLPTVEADALQLTQLFQNLLGNALKYREPTRAPHISISHRSTTDGCTVSVKDNGIGIAPRHFERIFVIFQRLHARSEYEGSGIGLALCKRIIEHHGGRIWVESEPGLGSTFFFFIPHKQPT